MEKRNEQITPGYNRRLAKKRFQSLNEALCPENRDLVLADSFVLRNPLLRQAPKRCLLCGDTLQNSAGQTTL